MCRHLDSKGVAVGKEPSLLPHGAQVLIHLEVVRLSNLTILARFLLAQTSTCLCPWCYLKSTLNSSDFFHCFSFETPCFDAS